MLRQEFLWPGEVHSIKQPNLKKINKILAGTKQEATTTKTFLRSIRVQDLEKEENLCMCEKEGEVAVIERKEAKGDKINCDYLVESRHLTALSDS